MKDRQGALDAIDEALADPCTFCPPLKCDVMTWRGELELLDDGPDVESFIERFTIFLALHKCGDHN